jgi:hypothetical protein
LSYWVIEIVHLFNCELVNKSPSSANDCQTLPTETMISETSKRIREIQERCLEMAALATERESAEIIQLPLWHEGKSGSPNAFLRSALFATIQGKDRVYLENMTLFSQQGYTVKFTGKLLNQEEEGQATGFVREGSNFIRLSAEFAEEALQCV